MKIKKGSYYVLANSCVARCLTEDFKNSHSVVLAVYYQETEHEEIHYYTEDGKSAHKKELHVVKSISEQVYKALTRSRKTLPKDENQTR